MIRAASGILAASISAHVVGRSNKRSAMAKASATTVIEQPSSSASSNGCSIPMRLIIRLASFVAIICGRSRWVRIACLCAFAIGAGNAASSSLSIAGSAANGPSSAASCAASFAVDSRIASSGRVRPLPSASRRKYSSFASSPSTTRSSLFWLSKVSINRT